MTAVSNVLGQYITGRWQNALGLPFIRHGPRSCLTAEASLALADIADVSVTGARGTTESLCLVSLHGCHPRVVGAYLGSNEWRQTQLQGRKGLTQTLGCFLVFGQKTNATQITQVRMIQFKEIRVIVKR